MNTEEKDVKKDNKAKEKKQPKKRTKKQLMMIGGAVALAVIVLLGAGIFIGSRVLVRSDENSEQNIAYDNDAKEILANAITMTQVYNYEPEHGNFNGMNAKELTRLDPKTKYTDGRPEDPNEVGVSEVSTDGFYLVVVSKSGREFTARKKPGQGIKLNYWTVDPRKVPSKEE